MKKVTIHGENFRQYISAKDIDNRLDGIAHGINSDFQNKSPLFLIILNGAFLFGTEIVKRFKGECEIEFVRIKSYQGMASSGSVSAEKLEIENISGRHVLILEDIIDSGKTLHTFLPMVNEFQPASISIATLLFKPEALKFNIPISYCGFKITNEFVVGYGMDFDGLGRNLQEIYIKD